MHALFRFVFLSSLVVGVALVALFTGASVFLLNTTNVDFSPLENYSPAKPTILYDCHGREWTRFQLDRRAPISLAEIPPCVITAFLVAEDRSFYTHHGVSVRAILRSCAVNFVHGRFVQGASTITQQLVKLLFVGSQKTVGRKLKELVMALVVELRMSKDQILETYLNHVYFGAGIYGVEAACQRFWGMSVRDATWAEAAMLAGIVRSPTRYCPLLHPQRAQNRRAVVLKMLSSADALPADKYVQAGQAPVVCDCAESGKERAPHAREMVRQFLEEKIGATALYSQGYCAQTTLDLDVQERAETSFRRVCERVRRQHKVPLDGAIVSMDSARGGVRALVGGFDFGSSQYNRATQARRQPGSAFKPFVYLAAIEQGRSFCDVEIDEPITIQTAGGEWQPRNVYRSFDGPMSLALALVRSCNIISVKTLMSLGVERVIDCAQRCGFKGPLLPYPSLALGCVETSALELVAAFNVIMNHGVFVEPYVVEWVKDGSGAKIWHHIVHEEQRVAWKHTSQLVAILAVAMKRYKEVGGHTYAGACAGKTGTTNDARSCWFVGATPSLTTAVYVGQDDNAPMSEGVYAMGTALPIWAGTSSGSEPNSGSDFVYDPALALVYIDPQSGRIVPADSSGAYKIALPVF